MYIKYSELEGDHRCQAVERGGNSWPALHGLSLKRESFSASPWCAEALRRKAIRSLNRYPDPTCETLIVELAARLGVPEKSASPLVPEVLVSRRIW